MIFTFAHQGCNTEISRKASNVSEVPIVDEGDGGCLLRGTSSDQMLYFLTYNEIARDESIRHGIRLGVGTLGPSRS